MGRETIIIDGAPTITLSELLRPGLKAVFVGLNPSPTSVAAGHYYQGQHGRTLWKRLQRFGILEAAPVGQEDMHAFANGFGFADLVRRPTRSAGELSTIEKKVAVDGLVERLKVLGNHPVIAFTYAEPLRIAGGRLQAEGYTVVRTPSPYERDDRMTDVRLAIEHSERTRISREHSE